MKLLIFYLCIGCCVLSACKTKIAANPDFAYDYMPLEIGRYSLYDADSVVYDKFSNSKRSFKFQIKEKIESLFKDNTGQDFYKIARYKRRQDSLGNFTDSTFLIKTIYTMGIVQNSLQVVEDNQKYVDLIFPPNLNQAWDAHVYNSKGEQNYFIQVLNEKISLNNQTYDNVCQVVEIKSNPEIKIFKKYSYTTYAKNIGIIERYVMDIASQKNLSLPIEDRIEDGLIFHLKLNRYGKE